MHGGVFLMAAACICGCMAENVADDRIDTIITPSGTVGHDVKRAVFGVNQLNYGKWSYNFVSGKTGKVNPEMTTILKEIGVKAMRYPGGCGGTHGYEWKVSAGLVKGRRYSLQLMEFLKCCEDIEAEPILGISALRGTPEEAAQFVEFLNSPDDGAHPWAAERARLGHPKPYGVKWIEYGNESYDNGHKPADPERPMNGIVYGANYVKFRQTMKTVDPKIQLGAVMLGDSGMYWDGAIFEAAGKDIDFIIVHSYGSAAETSARDYLRLFGRQDQLRKKIDKIRVRCKRADVPVLVTEFNTTISTHKTLTAALINAEALMYFVAEPTIANADYWQFVNEGFGMVRGKPGEYVKRPNALCYELFTAATLDRWQAVEVKDVAGFQVADWPKLSEEEKIKDWYAQKKRWWHRTKDDSRFKITQHSDGTIETEFLKDDEMNFYHGGIKIGDIPPGNEYNWKLEAEISVTGMQNTGGFFLQFGDGRGWNATHSVERTPATLAADWIPVEAVYMPLPDTKSLQIQLRRSAGGGRGIAKVRNVRLYRVERGAVERPMVGAQMTLSRDGRSAAFVLVNRTMEKRTVEIAAVGQGGYAHVSARTLSASSPWDNNEEIPDNVKISPHECSTDGKSIKVVLPPHSLTSVSSLIKE